MKLALATAMFLASSSAMATSLIPNKRYVCGALQHQSGPELSKPDTYEVMISAKSSLDALIVHPNGSKDIMDEKFTRLKPVSKKGKTAVFSAGDIEVTVVTKGPNLDDKKISIAKISNKDWNATCKIAKR